MYIEKATHRIAQAPPHPGGHLRRHGAAHHPGGRGAAGVLPLLPGGGPGRGAGGAPHPRGDCNTMKKSHSNRGLPSGRPLLFCTRCVLGSVTSPAPRPARRDRVSRRAVKSMGLGHVGVHARGGGGGDVLGEHVGRGGDEGHGSRVLPLQGPDLPGGPAAVQHGHLHIQQHRLVPVGRGLLEQLHRLLAVPGLGDLGPGHGEQLGDDLHVHLIVLRPPAPRSPLQGGGRPASPGSGGGRPPAGRRKGQHQGEHGTLPRLALDGDLPVHLGHQAFGDGPCPGLCPRPGRH